MKKVYIACPSYTGKTDIETFHCLRQVTDGIRRMGWNVQFKFTVGNSLISHARDSFVADFLHSDCTDLVMIDDDIWWEDDAVLRLLSHGKDVVGGVYPLKQPDIKFPVKRIEGERPDANGLLKVKMLPGGFLSISRNCAETMTAHYKHLAYTDDRLPHKHNCALFLPELIEEDGQRSLWGEDFMFCRRWRDMGGEVFADTLLRFKHIGRAAYEGCYADYFPEVTNAQPG
jgi:glycosyltransferase involved in cell wall biosynthesis